MAPSTCSSRPRPSSTVPRAVEHSTDSFLWRARPHNVLGSDAFNCEAPPVARLIVIYYVFFYSKEVRAFSSPASCGASVATARRTDAVARRLYRHGTNTGADIA